MQKCVCFVFFAKILLIMKGGGEVKAIKVFSSEIMNQRTNGPIPQCFSCQTGKTIWSFSLCINGQISPSLMLLCMKYCCLLSHYFSFFRVLFNQLLFWSVSTLTVYPYLKTFFFLVFVFRKGLSFFFNLYGTTKRTTCFALEQTCLKNVFHSLPRKMWITKTET